MSNPKTIFFFQLQYNENPDDFIAEVESFAKLRNTACVYISSKNETALENMKQYYCQLQFFKNRFKVLDSPLMKKGPFDFPWADLDDDPLNPLATTMHAGKRLFMSIFRQFSSIFTLVFVDFLSIFSKILRRCLRSKLRGQFLRSISLGQFKGRFWIF